MVIAIVAPLSVHKSLGAIFEYFLDANKCGIRGIKEINDDSLIDCLEYCEKYF